MPMCCLKLRTGETVPTLNMYENECETVIAYDPQDAVKVWEETVGQTYPVPDDEFQLVPDETEVTIVITDTDDKFPIAGEFTKTAREWVDEVGRCYFSSTEY